MTQELWHEKHKRKCLAHLLCLSNYGYEIYLVQIDMLMNLCYFPPHVSALSASVTSWQVQKPKKSNDMEQNARHT